MKIELYTKASGIEEAFIIGNGNLGARHYGGTITDKIELSENTFADNRKNGNHNGYNNRLPVGKIQICHQEYTETEDISDYKRSLDLESGIAAAEYKINGIAVHTQAFVSHPHKMLVYEMTSENKNLNLRISFEKSRGTDSVRYHIGGIFFVCQAIEHMQSDSAPATLLLGKVSLYTDGFPQAHEDGLMVRNASRVALYITSITDFKEPRLEKEAQILQLQMKMNRSFVKVEEHTFEQILEAHKTDMLSLYEKAALSRDNQPVTGKKFQMDGIFCIPVSEMLMQSCKGTINFLPCLPQEWKKGQVKGVRANGSIRVDITWGNGHCKVYMTAEKNTKCLISYQNKKKKVNLKAKETRLVWND